MCAVESVVSRENAESQVNEFFDFYDIDLEEETPLVMAWNRLVKAVEKGRLEIGTDEDGDIAVTQHLKKAKGEIKTLNYRVLTGAHKITADAAKNDQTHKKMYLLIGALTGHGVEAIKKLRASDLGLVEILGLVFMSA